MQTSSVKYDILVSMKNKQIVLIGLAIIATIVLVLAYINIKSIRVTDGVPAVETEENTATTSKTTKNPTPTSTQTSKNQSNSYLGRDGVYVVQYTDTGFVPKELQIPKGKSVRFINVSSKGMRVYTDFTADSKFAELNEAKTIGKGGTYTFSFVIEGLWAYHNQVNPTHTANIIVY